MKVASYKAYQPHATWLDKLIAIFSLGKYSHTEIVFSTGECFSISPREKKVRFKKITLGPEQWDVLSLNLGQEEETMLYHYACRLEKEGYKYDYTGALFSLFPICVQKPNRFFCSELATNILSKIEPFWYLNDSCTYSPSELYEALKNSELVMESIES